ncbi:MAG: restriction endonuclease subunit S, partial [Paludibacteraceae bacterium]
KPLLQLCQSYIQECKHKYTIVELEPSIVLKEEKNTLNENLQVVGINITKRFMPTNANIDGIDTRKYKIICKKRFVFSGMQTGRDMSIRIGMYNGENRALISPAYTTFEIDESKGFLSEYIALYFMRAEMDRYGAFLSDSSVRANLDWNRFIHISIPLPPIEVQQAIVNLYRCAQECQALAKEAAEQAKTICPALIQQVIHKTK